jgi:PAS domain S-box-containing protein
MEEFRDDINHIRELLAANKEGMSITDLSSRLNINRNTVAKYMEILQIQGAADGRKRGTSKVFYLTERIPALSLKKVCSRPYFVVDMDGTVSDANHEFCTLTGITADQLIRQSSETVPLCLTDGTSPGKLIRTALKGSEQRARAQVRKGDRIVQVTLVMIPIVFQDGRPGVSVMADPDNPSPNLQTKSYPPDDILALLDDEIEYVVRRTAEGITHYVNETYCRAVGKSREELVSRPFKPLVSPEDAIRIQEHLARLSVKYPVGTIEYKAVMANGELRYQRWQDRALFNSRGELDMITSFGIDITEQVIASQKLKKAHETLEESIVQRTEELRGINRQLYAEIAERERIEEQLLLAQFAMDKATDIVFWIGQDGRIQYANDVAGADLVCEKSGIIESFFGDIVGGYSQEEWDRLWQELKSGGQVSRETYLMKKDGTRLPADVRLTHFEYRGKEFVYCSSRNISERIRMDQALKEANKKLNVYSSIARHDIQNKITILLAYLGRTKKAVSDPRLLDYLGHLEKAAKAIRTEINLTRDFKDMGIDPPEWQEVSTLVSGVAEHYAETPVRISIDLPRVEIYADRKLEHVLDRLLERSLEKEDHPRKIRVSHQVGDGGLSIIFENDGPGYRPDEREGLFELKSDSSANRELFIAREILSLTGITLAENGEFGKGARFEVKIPETYYRFVPRTA